MENQEEIHDVLSHFEKKPSQDIPSLLEDYLRSVAKTGKTLFPWSRVKPLFICKLEQVMEQFHKDVPFDHLTPYPNVENVKYIEMKSRIVEALQKFNGAPFTVQRICELVTQPRKHYTRCDKFLRGIEKNVQVVSSVDTQGKKIVSESSHGLVNGLDVNGFNQQRDNDITDGQPFAPLTAWTASNNIAVWPGMQTTAVNSLDAITKSIGSDTEADQHVPSEDEESKLSALVTDSPSSEPSAQPLSSTSSTSQSSTETVTDSVSSCTSSLSVASDERPPDEAVTNGAVTFDFQTLPQSSQSEVAAESVSSETTIVSSVDAESASLDESRADTGEVSHKEMTEVGTRSEESSGKEVESAPDVTETTNLFDDGSPPEKKMRLSEASEDGKEPMSNSETVTTQVASVSESEETESATCTKDNENETEAETGQVFVEKTKEEFEESEKSDSKSVETTRDCENDQSAITSSDGSDDIHNNRQSEQSENVNDIQTDQSEADSVELVSQSELPEETGFTVSEDAEAEPDSGECSEKCENTITSVTEETKEISNECNSTTEVMETDSDNKSEEATNEAKSNEDGQEPMEQE